MRISRIVLALLVCVGLAIYTSYKLERMNRIEAGQGTMERVVRKTVEQGRRSEVCFLWTREKTQADCDYWDTVQVGDRIEVITVDGDRYVKGGDVYTSEGNFVFDKILLVAEILGAVVCVVLLIVALKARA